MGELVAAGKVRYLGLSEASARSLDAPPPCTRSPRCRPSIRSGPANSRATCSPTARRLGIGFVAYCPLGRGFLAGAVKRPRHAVARRRAPEAAPFPGREPGPNVATLGGLRELAEKKGITVAQLALAWVLARGPDVVPIPGTKRARYVDENVAAAGVTLTGEELALIEDCSPAGAWAGQRSSGQLTQGFGDSPERR